MAASYPTSVKSFTTKVDGAGNVIAASHVNGLQDEVVAIEGALIDGFTHDLKPTVAGAEQLGTSSLPWGTAHVGAIDLPDATELTIASGAIVPTQGYHKIDTEADAAADDLATLTATNATAGFIVVLRAENVARVVTLKDGTGNLLLNGDYAMSATDRTITLIYDGTNWREIARSVGAGSGFVEVLDRKNAETSLNNSNTETDMYTKTVTGSTLGSTRSLRFSSIGTAVTTANARTLRVRVYYGATVIFDHTVSMSASATTSMLILAVELMAANATNAQRAKGRLTVQNNGGGVAGVANQDAASQFDACAVHASVAEDSTADKVFKVTYLWSATDAGATAKLMTANLELL